jgi:succinate dehydrogenase / fumarate reductase, cytochrome b subunit
VQRPRPINLNLMTIRFPITAVVSILHRLTGVLLAFLIPFLLWALSLSLQSEAGFLACEAIMRTLWMKLLVWFALSGLFYHLIAGIRHLLMDVGWADSRQSGPLGAQIVVILSVMSAAGLGVWLW